MKRVLLRGSIPADILFIGEAPGESENVVGTPFVGPAGKLLDHMIQNSIQITELCSKCFGIQQPNAFSDKMLCANRHEGQPSVIATYAMTNLVACIPWDGDRTKVDEPPDICVTECSDRLRELMVIVRPKVVVLVGASAQAWLHAKPYSMNIIPSHVHKVCIDHPAYILRANIAQRGILIQRNTIRLNEALDYLFTQDEETI